MVGLSSFKEPHCVEYCCGYLKFWRECANLLLAAEITISFHITFILKYARIFVLLSPTKKRYCADLILEVILGKNMTNGYF